MQLGAGMFALWERDVKIRISIESDARQEAGTATRQALDLAKDLHGKSERMRAHRRLNPSLLH